MKLELVYQPSSDRTLYSYVHVLDVYELSVYEAMKQSFEGVNFARSDFVMHVNGMQWHDWPNALMKDALSSWLDVWSNASRSRKHHHTMSIQLTCRPRFNKPIRRSLPKLILMSGVYVDFICRNSKCECFGQVVRTNLGHSCILKLNRRTCNLAIRCPLCQVRLQHSREIQDLQIYNCGYQVTGKRPGLAGHISYYYSQDGTLREILGWEWSEIIVRPSLHKFS